MLVQHSTIYAVSRIVGGSVSFATAALLTHLLDAESYGVYGLALVVMALVSNTWFEWLGLAFTRFSQGLQDRARAIATVLRIFAGLVAVLAVCAMIAVAVVSDASLRLTFVAGALLAGGMAWSELTLRFAVNFFRPFTYFVINVSRAILVLVFAVGVAWLTQDPILAATGAALGMIGSTLAGLSFRKGVHLGAYDNSLARQLFSYGIPIALTMTLGGLGQTGVRVVVQMLGSSAALGFYTVAFLLVSNTLTFLAAGISSAGYPLALRELERDDAAGARRQLFGYGALLFAIIAPAALGLMLTAQTLARSVLGAEFVPEVARLTPLLAVGAFFNALRGHFLDCAFQFGRKMRWQLYISSMNTVLILALAVYLVPEHGSRGAALAVTIASVATTFVSFVLGRRAFPLPFPLGQMTRVVICCGWMAVVVMAVPSGANFSLAAQVLAGGLTYGLAAFALNVMGVRQHLSGLLWRSRS